MYEEQWQEARQLITEKRYDEARRVLAQIDHPTARKWLQKLDSIAPQLIIGNSQKISRSAFITMAVVFIAASLIGIYLIFLSSTNNAQASNIETRIISDLQSIDVRLDGLQSELNIQNQQSNVIRSNIYEYLTMSYTQNDLDFDYNIEEFIIFSDLEYQEQIAGELLGCEFEPQCTEQNSHGLAYYLNSLGNEGWELRSLIDKSDEYTYKIEIVFIRTMS